MTKEERKELAALICKACERVWQSIGQDVLALEGGDASATLVVEMCVDADRLKMFDELDAVAAWELLSEDMNGYTEQLQFVAGEMLYEVYGY